MFMQLNHRLLVLLLPVVLNLGLMMSLMMSELMHTECIHCEYERGGEE